MIKDCFGFKIFDSRIFFQEIITGSKIQHGILGRFNLWSRDFFGFCWKPYGFFEVSVFAPIRSSPSLEIRSTPNTPHPSPRMQTSTSCYRQKLPLYRAVLNQSSIQTSMRVTGNQWTALSHELSISCSKREKR